MFSTSMGQLRGTLNYFCLLANAPQSGYPLCLYFTVVYSAGAALINTAQLCYGAQAVNLPKFKNN